MRRSTKILITFPGASMLSAVLRCRCLPRPCLSGRVIRRHRRQIGSCWRKLNPGRQALLVLAHLRNGETFAGLAAGFGVGTATASRYARETITLLAARAPTLRDALPAASTAGMRWRSSTAPSSPSTGWPLTGRSTPASTAATA
jgi:hypothetical protein